MAKLKTGPLFKSKTDDAPARQTAVTPDTKKPKRGKHLISGLFEEPTYRQFTMLAAELGVQRQDLLREALNDLFLKHGKMGIA